MAERGFTLVEVLIAMAITAFVAAASYAGISSVVSGAEQLRIVGERTRDLNRALAMVDRDIRQVVNRPVRDEFGNLQPALAGGPLAFFPLSLTREGWHNSQQLPRSDLQRVEYYLEDEALWRAYYPILDRAAEVEPLRTKLLDAVEELELRFLPDGAQPRLDRELVVDTRDWARNWVADTAVPAADLPAPPAALELRLTLEDFGDLRRIYVLPVL